MRSMACSTGFLIILLCLSSVVYGKSSGSWKPYTCPDGLAGGNIRSMVEDNEGNLWIATEGDGVSRYDGESFENFTKDNTDSRLPGNFALQILKDSKGNLWFAVWGHGVCKYDGKDFAEVLTIRDGLVSDFIHSISEDKKGNLWFGARAGVSRYDGGRFENFTTEHGFLPDERVSAILEDAAGNVWIGTTVGNIYNYDAHSRIFRPSHRMANGVISIAEGRSGDLWFGTWEGLYRYDGKDFLPFPLTDKESATEIVQSIMVDRQGNLWFATTDGVRKYDGNIIESFIESDGLAHMDVTAIVEDREAGMWFGTWGGGICQYDDKIQNYSLSQKEIEQAIEDRNGNLWFTTKGAGVFRYDRETLQSSGDPDHFTIEDGIANNEAGKVIKDDKGNLWFDGVGGITRYNGEAFEAINDAKFPATAQVVPILSDSGGSLWLDIREDRDTTKIAKYNVSRAQIFPMELPWGDNKRANYKVGAVLEDSAGNIWFGMSPGGIYRYNGIALEHFKATETAGLDGDSISSIVEDAEGNVWFGISGNDRPRAGSKGGAGLSMYDGRQFHSVPISSNSVSSSLKDKDNNLWFGTWHGGVSRYDGEFEDYTTDDGLASNTINYLLSERKRSGYLWLGTQSGGVSQYDGKNFQTLTKEDGLLSNWVEPLIEDRYGNIWFSYEQTATGSLTKYTPRKIPPQIQISHVVADDTYENAEKAEPFKVRTLSNVRDVVFHYRALTISQLDSMRYTFQLEGYDAEPRVTESRQVKYENLEPGEYVFTVRAIDRDLNYSAAESAYLTVVPPWHYQKRYIIPLGLIGLVFLMAFVLVSWRYSSNRREMLEQEQRSREELQSKNAELQKAKEAAEDASRAKSDFLAKMGHEIRTPLSTILGYTHILQRNRDLKYEVHNALEKIGDSGRDLLKLINNVLDISKIETERVELQNVEFDLVTLIDGLSRDFMFRCEKSELGWRLEWQKGDSEGGRGGGVVSLTRPPSRLPIYGDEVKLRQVLFNLLSNSVKFTESGEVTLRIVLPADSLFGELGSQAADSTQSATQHTPDALPFTFEVIDTGVGISPEDRSTIFGLFQQGERGKAKDGIGLGLNIAKGNIELMDGQLDFESEPGCGSRFFFTVSLQLAKGEISPSSIDVKRRAAHLAPGYEVSALVVDDVPENQEILVQMLSDIGVHVMSAGSGDQALDCVRSQRPDIVFMDIYMSPMDGIEAAKQIWAEFGKESIKIVAVSASALDHERKTYLSTGFDAFIARPFLAEEIYDCLASILRVEYEYEDLQPESIPLLDLSDIELPANLIMRLEEAAEFYSVTELKSCLDEIKEFSEAGQRLAEYLYPLLQAYDMKGILDVLSEVQQNEP